jgi:hypothetical protein
MRVRRGQPADRTDAADALRQTRRKLAQLQSERDLLASQLRTAAAGERSVLAELHRLRELTAGRAERDDASARRYLVVATVGRTGSTVVQGVLNTATTATIRGENSVIPDLFRMHSKAMKHRDRLTREQKLLDATHPWWGMDGYPADLALREIRHLALDLVLRPDPATELAGFKNIEWPDDDVAGYLGFLRAIFPGLRVLLNTRDLDEIASSGFWANRPNGRPRLEALDAALRAAVAELGSDAMTIDYASLVSDPDSMRPIFDWLDLPYEKDAIAAIMQVPHSYAPRQQTPTE